MRLLLIRHAQTTSNVLHLLDTAEPGAALTEVGMAQAAGLVGALCDEPIDVLMASTLLRAQQTATPLALARTLPLGIRDGIREISACELEMRGDVAASDLYQATALDWASGELDSVIAGAGAGRDMLAAFDEVVAEAESSGAATAVLVSHGAAIVTWGWRPGGQPRRVLRGQEPIGKHRDRDPGREQCIPVVGGVLEWRSRARRAADLTGRFTPGRRRRRLCDDRSRHEALVHRQDEKFIVRTKASAMSWGSPMRPPGIGRQRRHTSAPGAWHEQRGQRYDNSQGAQEHGAPGPYASRSAMRARSRRRARRA
jgi:broad specificity phosphatase PhoE